VKHWHVEAAEWLAMIADKPRRSGINIADATLESLLRAALAEREELTMQLAVALKLGRELADNPDRKLPSHLVLADAGSFDAGAAAERERIVAWLTSEHWQDSWGVLPEPIRNAVSSIAAGAHLGTQPGGEGE
jgi:hypothetical protein